jgi:CHAT domain-containing protein/Flp pilus assembly protein TadD
MSTWRKGRVRRLFLGMLRVCLFVLLAAPFPQAKAQSRSPDKPQHVLSLGEQHIVEIAGGGNTAMAVEVEADRYVRLLVAPQGVRISYRLSGPGGEELGAGLAWRDTQFGISFLARTSGSYSLRLECDDAPDRMGRLTVEITDLREPSAADDDRLRADDLRAEADELREEYRRADSVRAIEKYAAAAEIWAEVGDLRDAAVALLEAGALSRETSDLEQSARYLTRGTGLSRQVDFLPLQSELLSDAGLTHALRGEHDEGIKKCREAVELARKAGAGRREAKALYCLAELDYHSGNHKDALELYGRALELTRDFSDRRAQGEVLLVLGYTYSDLSDFDPAKVCFRDALSAFRSVADKRGEAITLLGAGRLDLRLGEYQAALNAFRSAEPILEATGDPLWLASLASGLASVYERVGRLSESAAKWDQAVELFRQAGVGLAVVDVLQSAGETHLISGDHASALACFREALSLSEELGNTLFQAAVLRYLGRVYQVRGELGEALRQYQRSLAIQQALHDQKLEADTRSDTGSAYEKLGDRQKAEEFYRQAIRLSEEARDQMGQSIGHYRLARLLGRGDDLEAARRHIEESLSISEQLRKGVSSYDMRAAYLASVHQRYELHVDLLMRLHQADNQEGHDVEALEASERARARTLLESLSEAGVDIRTGAARELLNKEKSLKRTIDAKAERFMRVMSTGSDEDGASSMETEIRELDNRLDELRAEIRSKSPRYASLTQPEPLNLHQIQTQVLDADTVLLEYALGEERSYLWAVTTGGSSSHTLAPRALIEARALELYELLTARQYVPGESGRSYRLRVRQAEKDYWKVAAAVSELLLSPVAHLIQGKRILVVADGALQFVPFGALPKPGGVDDRQPMLLHHEVVNLPSASALAVLRREAEGRTPGEMTVAVLADPVFDTDDPRLNEDRSGSEGALSNAGEPGSRGRSSQVFRSLRQVGFTDGDKLVIPRLLATRQEAEAIIALAPKDSSLNATGFEANLDTARSPDLSRFRVVHFATHGVVNSVNPGLSGIILSLFDEEGHPRNGFLRLDDIYNLDLPAELVVISACSSALGQNIRGEGLVGIVRGFMYAGASRVLASLWKVDDMATRELMVRFYKNLFSEGQSPAAALRNAQIAMSQHPDWRSPYYWAAFVLQGEWR